MSVPPTVCHRPERRRWILTGTLRSHAEKPSVAVTSPLATRWRERRSDTVRPCFFPVTVNVPELVTVPPGVVTLIFPVVAPEGTVAVILLAELMVKVALVPLNLTDVAPVKFEPLITTVVPTGPLFGLNPEMVGAPVTVNVPELVSVPPGVVTLILPVVAPEGTVAVILLAELMVNVALVPLNFTEVAPVKFEPLITTEVPTGPLFGLNPVMVGAGCVPDTVKFEELVAVPPGVVTLIFPVVAPEGTVAVILLEELMVNVALVPLNFTEVAPVKFVPWITTEVPARPLLGLKPEMVGADCVVTVKLPELVEVPPGVVTLILPVVAPEGTVAVILLAELIVKVALVPSNFTEVAPVKFEPLIVTEVPTGPLFGLNPEMVGAPVTVNVPVVMTNRATTSASPASCLLRGRTPMTPTPHLSSSRTDASETYRTPLAGSHDSETPACWSLCTTLLAGACIIQTL